MEESKYAKTILDEFKKKFPIGWIDQLNWNVNKNQQLRTGLANILDFQIKLFENLSKLILSGDQLVSKTDSLDELLNLSTEDIVPEEGKSLKSRLQTRYADLLIDIHDSLYLVKYHKDLTEDRYKPQSSKVLVRAIPFKGNRENRSDYVSLLDDICQACWAEYIFSYNEDYISDLLMLREKLIGSKKGKAGIVITIIDVTINKINLLLGKLSVFSKEKRITYNFDFHENTISLSENNQYQEDDFRRYFLDFMDVERISSEKILSWQEESQEDNIKMWHLVFLMRYYVKKTKSKEQIDNLIPLFEKHYQDNSKDKSENIVNRFACRSGRNYMYNSRFSYYCQSDKNYSFNQMKSDLAEIEKIQNETFIFNYHPYQKAIEFSKKHLAKCISQNEPTEVLENILFFLKESFEKFKNNVEWCKANQPYLMQLRFTFATIKDQGIDVFCPSTFCRPLRFQKLYESIQQISNEITSLDYQVSHHSDRLEFMEAKGKIDNMEKKNLETMSLVITVTTFLVGLLSIFIGNSDVSIFTKMEYVTALGLILLLFDCFGYFMLSDLAKKYKAYICGFLTALFICMIGYFFIDFHKLKYSKPPKSKPQSETVCNTTDNNKIETQSNPLSTIQDGNIKNRDH